MAFPRAGIVALTRRQLCFAVLLLTTAATAHSLRAQTDSTRIDSVLRLAPVEVQAARLLPSARHFVPTALIGRKRLRALGARQLSDALGSVPGVFIKNYGGLGGLQTISLRGGSAAQTLVLLDGMRLNASQNGLVDFSTFPLSLVEEIEVLRGGAAALYGGHALSGVVNIRSRPPSQRWTYGLRAEHASFGEYRAAGRLSLPIDSSSLALGLTVDHSDGDFPFDFNEFGRERRLRRSNGDFRNLAGIVQLRSRFAEWSLHAGALLRDTERGSPGAVVQGNLENGGARLSETDGLGFLRARRILPAGPSLALGAFLRRNSTRYMDPELFVGNQATEFQAEEAALQGNLRWLSKGSLLELRGEADVAALRGTSLQPDVGDRVQRGRLSLASRGEIEWTLPQLGELSAQAALRFDHYSDFGTVLSPLAGLALYRPDEGLTLRLLWSYNFRPPSFNELYYLNFGNANLKAERAHSFNLGLTWQNSDELRLELDAFLIRSSNQIVSVPKTPLSWTAENIGVVLSRGVEVAVLTSFLDGRCSFTAAYTLQRASDESPGTDFPGSDIVYAPRELLSADVQVKADPLSFGAATRLSGRRFALPGGEPGSALPAHWLTTLFLEKQWQWNDDLRLGLRLDLDNVFDVSYTVIRNYPMPGRMARLTISLDRE